MDNLPNSRDQELYAEALGVLRDSKVEFMLGGALAVYHYTNWWRNTHDVDIYVLPESATAARQALEEAGFHDLGEQAQGDREWIYHLEKDSLVVDIIWRFDILAYYVTPDWFARASRGRFLGMDVRFLPLEELAWVKVFVINRHRCDWPDIMRMIRAQCQNMNWARLLEMLGEHWLLLAALIDVFDWQHPASMDCIPGEIRRELAQRREHYRPSQVEVDRERLLDPWLMQRADVYAARRDE